jgi:glycosyltransferase involved in cell wall biosynthesis
MAADRSAHRLVVNALALRGGGDGARIYLENVLRELPSAWQGTVCALVRPGVELQVAGLELVSVAGVDSGLARVRAEWTTVASTISSLRPDVFLSPNESLPRRLAVPTVVVAQNLLYHCACVGPLPRGGPRARLRSRAQFAYYRRQMPRAYARAAIVAAVSRNAAEMLAARAGLDPARVRIVPCGADRLPAADPALLEGRVLLAVGSIAHYKRLDVAIRALARLGPAYRLVLAGEAWPGEWPELERIAAAAGVSRRVQYVGVVSDADLAALLAGAHAVLALSACESFGIPVVEAMRARLPVVAADERWARELVGEAGMLVEPTPDRVAEAVLALADERTRAALAAAGSQAAARYTWRRTAEGLAAAAAEAIDGGPPR